MKNKLIKALLLPFFSLLYIPVSQAACNQNAPPSPCSFTYNGQEFAGTNTCVGLHFICFPHEFPDPIEIELEYHVAAVYYAPPGSADGTPSSITYGDKSAAGSTSSITSTELSSVGLDLSISAGGVDILSGGYKQKTTNSDTSATTISKSFQHEINIVGSNLEDGLDHNQDRIDMYLNPILIINPGFDNSDDYNDTWRIDTRESDLVTVYVQWLENPESMPQELRILLNEAGIDQADYDEILKASIYYDDEPVTKEHPRLLPAMDNTRINYLPPPVEGQTGDSDVFRIEMSKSILNSTSETTETTKSLSIGAKVQGNIFGFSAGADLTLQTSYKRTNSNVSTETESVTYRAHPPSFGYRGAIAYDVYIDSLYKTFVFIPQKKSIVRPELNDVLIQVGDRVLRNAEVTYEDEDGNPTTTRTDRFGRVALPSTVAIDSLSTNDGVPAGLRISPIGNLPNRPEIIRNLNRESGGAISDQ